MDNFRIFNIDGERFRDVSDNDWTRYRDYFDRLIDKLQEFQNSTNPNDCKAVEHFLEGVSWAPYVIERNADHSNPLIFWRSVFLAAKEVNPILEEYLISRFSYPPDWKIPDIPMGRCNLANQQIFYGANSGRVVRSEVIFQLDEIISEKGYGCLPDCTLGLSQWRLTKNMTFSLIWDFEQLKYSPELEEIKAKFENSQIPDWLKTKHLQWFKFLAGIFKSEGKEWYTVTSAISNYIYRFGLIDGIVYQPVKFEEVEPEVGTKYQAGMNYAILPSSFRVNDNVIFESCSIMKHRISSPTNIEFGSDITRSIKVDSDRVFFS